MDPENDVATDEDLTGAPTPVHALVDAAAGATATAYTRDGDTDVVQHLRDTLAARGIGTADDAWLEEVARRIRSGHEVDIDDASCLGLPGTKISG